MKIEKINDKQIRCTLTREDLVNREIKLSDLAYGSEKTKALFHDMMQVAAQDFGFEAENIPLVIEAVPISMDSIILIITKVDDPEELDTRFARFSPEDTSGDGSFSFNDLKDKIEGADDVLGLIKRLSEAKKRAAQKAAETAQPESAAPEQSANENTSELPNLTRFYLFNSLDDAILAARVLCDVYEGSNSLYKDAENNQYFLLLKKGDNSAENFNKICNILSEYALSCKYIPGMEAHFAEHMEPILKDNAIWSLSRLV